MVMRNEKCFACDRKLVKPCEVNSEDKMSDGSYYVHYVGPECYRKIASAGPMGYKPSKGGPRLFAIGILTNP